MFTPLTDSALAIVQAALLAAPEATTLSLGADRDSDGTFVWHDTAVLTVGKLGLMDALEIDAHLLAAFAAEHPADGGEHTIVITDLVRAAASFQRPQFPVMAVAV